MLNRVCALGTPKTTAVKKEEVNRVPRRGAGCHLRPSEVWTFLIFKILTLVAGFRIRDSIEDRGIVNAT